MVTDPQTLATILDHDVIGFLTAVDRGGQPQTAPVWFVRDVDDIVVYNKPDTPRLDSIAANPKIAFNLRGDRRAHGVVLIEGIATRETDLPPAKDFPGYLEKYAREIEGLGWTPESFSSDYSAGIRIVVTRTRAWGLDALAPR
jgi:PPOX class probable F420-dependent enzyme